MRHHPSPTPLSRLIASLVLCGLAACGDSDSSTAMPPAKTPGADGSVAPDGGTGAEASPGTDVGTGSETGTEAGPCGAGAIACGGMCVDPQTNASHCGTCDHACAAGQECHDGACEAAACDEPCATAGAKQCSGTGSQTCVEHASIPGCLEWSAVEPCPAGIPCDSGTGACEPLCGSACEPFSIVLLPDTQYYTEQSSTSTTYKKQTKWIVDHRDADNIRFVIHLGDVTDNNLAAQWQIASDAHATLDTADIPYSLAPGNHDLRVGSDFDRSGSLFDTKFPQDRFKGKSWYGGGYGSSNMNNYAFFEVGHLKFMVLSLEYAPRKEILCWAENLIAQHPEHRVIIATHCYLNDKGNYSVGCPSEEYEALGGNGADVWAELASRHSNIFMVVSGHINGSAYKLAKGNAGNDVHQMLVDYQFEATCGLSNPAQCHDHCHEGNYQGNGWLRLLTFDPLKNSVHAESISVLAGSTSTFPGGKPVLFCSELFTPSSSTSKGANDYPSDPTSAAHRFDFSYDMNSTVPYARNDLGKRAFIDRTVNSAGAGDQLTPKVVMAPGSSFVAVWEDDSSAADGPGNHDIMARGFSPGGCSGFKDLTVPTNTDGHQLAPAVAMDAQGNFVVVWADDPDGNKVYQIRGRGFHADGTERIAPFTVNSVAAGQQHHPAIAMAADGRFVVAWEDDPSSDSQEQIKVRGFAANGTQSFADRSVHSDAVGRRVRPAIALDASAGFVVAWQDDSDGNGSFQIHARGFDAAGNERFPRMTVNSQSAGQQRNPVVGASAMGSFVVAWEDDPQNDGKFQVLARGFDAQGAVAIAEFRPHAASGGQHVAPAISMEPQGRFAIAWQDDGDGNGSYQVRARVFKADGSQWKAEWSVNTVAAGQQLSPALALNESGALVTIWQDDMDGNGAYQIVAGGFDMP